MTDRPAQFDSSKAYIIAATPRSGSYYLSELLWNTGICGRPSEYSRSNDSECRPDADGPDREYLDLYLTRGWTRNGVFGAKLMWEQLVGLTEDLGQKRDPSDAEIAEVIADGFNDCRYIFLRRKDKLRQAISLYRALMTNRWHATIDDAKQRDEALEFSADEIGRLMGDLVAQEERWETFLRVTGAKYITVDYEDFRREPEKCVSTIFDFLEISGRREFIQGQLRKQADAVTESWVRMYENIAR